MKHGEKTNAIAVESLSYSIESKKLLSEIDLAVGNKEFVGLIGPNGSGKSTLLKNIYKQHKPDSGKVLINGKDVESLSNKELAKMLSVVTQEMSVEFDFSVWEMMKLSRLPHKGFLDKITHEDEKICQEALDKVGMRSMVERSFLSLSGGEKQRVLLAMAFAQQAEIIVLDEPTNHLDIGYQLLLMEMLKKEDLTIFTSFHDMNLAFRYCDKILVLKKGQVVAAGKPEEIITEELLRDVFNIEGHIVNEENMPLYVVYKNAIEEKLIKR